MENTGKLVRWNDNKGFGFIQCDDLDKDVFIHITTLKEMSRKPKNGDIIVFSVATDNEGKYKAYKARIQGVTAKRQKPDNSSRQYTSTKRGNGLSRRASMPISIGILALVIFVFMRLELPAQQTPAQTVTPSMEDFSEFSCQGKQHCSQMTSCKEARFYLKYCPNVKIDGDRDGQPCEQMCGH